MSKLQTGVKPGETTGIRPNTTPVPEEGQICQDVRKRVGHEKFTYPFYDCRDARAASTSNRWPIRDRSNLIAAENVPSSVVGQGLNTV
jgi:hypothetical protein